MAVDDHGPDQRETHLNLDRDCLFNLLLYQVFLEYSQWRRKIDNWGGGGGAIFIYTCSALLTSFEIDCF